MRRRTNYVGQATGRPVTSIEVARLAGVSQSTTSRALSGEGYVAAQVRETGAQALTVQADVTRDDDVHAAVTTTAEQFGGVDIAFNNAGTWTPAPFEQVDPHAWTAEIDVNLTSVYYCMRHEIPVMRERGGVIINNASVLGLVGVAGMAPYVAAKHAVVGLGRATALEYATTGIRINTIAPAGVDTPHYRRTQGADPAVDAWFRGAHPVGRLATAEEVAGLVLYLASDQAGFFSGAAVAMDGAWSAQ